MRPAHQITWLVVLVSLVLVTGEPVAGAQVHSAGTGAGPVAGGEAAETGSAATYESERLGTNEGYLFQPRGNGYYSWSADALGFPYGWAITNNKFWIRDSELTCIYYNGSILTSNWDLLLAHANEAGTFFYTVDSAPWEVWFPDSAIQCSPDSQSDNFDLSAGANPYVLLRMDPPQSETTGTITVSLWDADAIDELQDTVNIQVSTDYTPPTLPVVSRVVSSVNSLTLTVSSSDSGSGVLGFGVAVDFEPRNGEGPSPWFLFLGSPRDIVLDGLIAGKTYDVWISAADRVGNYSNATKQRLTVSPPPTVATLSPTDITVSGARLRGRANPNGLSTEVWFEWGQTSAYDRSGPHYTLSASDPEGQVVMDVTSMACSTTYHYRIVARNAGGTTLGQDVSFSTLACPTTTTSSTTTIPTTSSTTTSPTTSSTTSTTVPGTTTSSSTTTVRTTTTTAGSTTTSTVPGTTTSSTSSSVPTSTTTTSSTTTTTTPTGPWYGPMRFSTAVDAYCGPIGATTWFPAGTTKIWQSYEFNNVTPGQTFQNIWYLNGEQHWLGEGYYVLTSGAGCHYISQTGGLPAGNYRVDHVVDGIVVLSGQFAVGSATTSTTSTSSTTTTSITSTTTTTVPGCTYSLTPTSQSFSSNGGTSSFLVSTGSSCSWSAATSQSWIHVSTGSGLGSGYVYFTVDPNYSTGSRSGSITAGGKYFLITQSGTASTSTTTTSSSSTTTTVPSGGGPPIGTTFTAGYVIQTSAHSPGAAGTFWVTDAVLHNPGATSASCYLYLMKAGQDNSAASPQAVSVAAGKSVRASDLISTVFGQGNASGAILVGCNRELVVSSRTFNNAAGGTFGQYVEGYPVSQAIGQNQQARLIQLTKNAGFRTNIGFANIGGSSLAVRVDLYRSDGGSIGTKNYSLPPYGYFQETNIINTITSANVDDAYAVVSSSTPGASYFAYASVIDNRTGDPVCVVRVAVGNSGDPLYVPGTAHVTGVGGSNWRTDLELHNSGSIQATYTIALLKRDQANSNPETRSYGLSAGSAIRYNDIVGSMFGYSGAATLRITPTSGSLMATSRTYNDQPSGTYGQFVPGFSSSQAITYGQTARIVQMSRSAETGSGFRTNLGLVSVSGSQIDVEVALYSSTGALLGTKNYSLRPWESVQTTDIFSTVTSANVPDGYAVLRTTTPGGQFLAYASVIDNRSGDPIYVPAKAIGSTAPSGRWVGTRSVNDAGSTAVCPLVVDFTAGTAAAKTCCINDATVSSSGYPTVTAHWPGCGEEMLQCVTANNQMTCSGQEIAQSNGRVIQSSWTLVPEGF